MGSAVAASLIAPAAGKIAGNIGSKVLGEKAGGLLGTAAELGTSLQGGGGFKMPNSISYGDTSGDWTSGIVRPGGAAPFARQEVLGDAGSKLGNWFKDKDNQAFLYDAGLTALPWLMDKFGDEEVIEDMGGGGSPPPVATGGPGYSGGGAGGQYGVGWGFDAPNRAGYKPGRV